MNTLLDQISSNLACNHFLFLNIKKKKRRRKRGQVCSMRSWDVLSGQKRTRLPGSQRPHLPRPRAPRATAAPSSPAPRSLRPRAPPPPAPARLLPGPSRPAGTPAPRRPQHPRHPWVPRPRARASWPSPCAGHSLAPRPGWAAAAASSEPQRGRQSPAGGRSSEELVQAERCLPLRAALRRWAERGGDAHGKADR